MGRLLEKAERACLITRSLACTTLLEAKILVQEVEEQVSVGRS